jgi:hypothetical protein
VRIAAGVTIKATGPSSAAIIDVLGSVVLRHEHGVDDVFDLAVAR